MMQDEGFYFRKPASRTESTLLHKAFEDEAGISRGVQSHVSVGPALKLEEEQDFGFAIPGASSPDHVWITLLQALADELGRQLLQCGVVLFNAIVAGDNLPLVDGVVAFGILRSRPAGSATGR